MSFRGAKRRRTFSSTAAKVLRFAQDDITMILDDIVAHKREELATRQREEPLTDLKAAAKEAPPPRGFHAALRQSGLSVIAEVKRKSPAKGVLNQAVDPAQQATSY